MSFSDGVKRISFSGATSYFGMDRGDVIDLSIGEPRDQPSAAVIEAYSSALREKSGSRYAPVQGMQELREALSAKMKKANGIDAPPDQIMVTGGASEAIAFSIMSIVNRGDEVVILEPSYPIMAPMVRYCGGRPVSLKLEFGEGFRPAMDRFQEMVGRRTAMLLINSPHNPTGTVLRKGELRAFSEIFGGFILSDEVYENYTYGEGHSPLASLASRPENVITVNSFSKTYCMCGYRVGYVHACRELIRHMVKLKLCVSTCTSRPAQKAALAALRDMKFPRVMRERFSERREALLSGLESLGLPHVEPRGAFYVFPEISEFGKDEEAFGLFLKAGVLTMPGTLFHGDYAGHLRMSFAAPVDEIGEGVSRMEGVIA